MVGVRDALRAQDSAAALRQLDRAWRTLPEDIAALAPIYGRLLMLDAGDDEAALYVLRQSSAPDPDVAALIVLTLSRLRRIDDALRQLEASLAQYCVAPDQLLHFAAGELIRNPDVEAPGWIGRGPNLNLLGELSDQHSANVLQIALGGQGAFTQLLRTSPRQGARAFRFASPGADASTILSVCHRGVPLLGSGAPAQPNFDLDGRLGNDGARLTGWARLGWAPLKRLRLRIEDEYGRRKTVMTVDAAPSRRQGAFSADLREAQLRGNCLSVAAQLPDGRWQALPDSPLLLKPALLLAGHAEAHLPAWDVSPREMRRAKHKRARKGAPVDIIIPVYQGREATLACIDTVLATVAANTVVVVDDGVQDLPLSRALDELAAHGRITLLRNAQNQGFAASVNRALAQNVTHDAVLLNSDTRVFGDWLARLQAAAYSEPAIGTVTPFSNSGSIASYPRSRGAGMDPEEGAAWHALAASTHPGVRVEIPVGVGFCLYLRRDCLRDVGQLDAVVFGKGYGEETDYCLRARRRGWTHALAADVFVYHASGLSFAGRREALLERSERLINLRHPGYERFIAGFLAQDPLQALRRRLDQRRLQSLGGRFALILTHDLSGGVQRFVDERCMRVRAQGLVPLLLRACRGELSGRCELWSDAIELPNLVYLIPKDLAELTALLRELRIESVEIQHFLHLDARLVEAVRALPLPYDVFVHDYAWICPRVTLIDGSGRYCGEPAISACEACVRQHGSSLGEALSVKALRTRSEAWLRGARRVFVPSADTAARLERHFAGLRVGVWPRAPPDRAQSRPPPVSRKLFRIALLGAIGEHKGYRVLLACARDARKRRLPLEFVVIGYTENDALLLQSGQVFITGRYAEPEAPHLLRREQPDLVWLPSVWPETWCYALDHALGSGLPVVAFDVGAIAERLRAAGRGELLPLKMLPRNLNDRLLAHAQETRRAYVTASRSEQMPLSLISKQPNNTATPYHENHMTEVTGGSPAEVVPPSVPVHDSLGASVQVLRLPGGVYLFSVKSAAAAPAGVDGSLALPAMHVGLGPGVRSEQVEFMAGPSTHGAWLFAATDLLVVKVHGPGAMLIMTSVRGANGEVLSIKVERLNAGGDAPQNAIAAAAAPLQAAGEPAEGVAPDAALSVRIRLHVRSRGDMIFTASSWAGRVGPGLWIESFSVSPLQGFAAKDIEYKGLTGSGFETPWLSEDMPCGTQGMGVPLVGFALRFKPSPEAAAYDCEYCGYFRSGQTVGPVRNGVPCRSSMANDPLEGIQVRLLKRQVSGQETNPGASAPIPARRIARAAQRHSSRRP